MSKAKAAPSYLPIPPPSLDLQHPCSDVPHTPHPLARAIVHADGSAELFLDKRKTGIEQEAYLTQLADIMAPATFDDRLAALARPAQPS